MKEFDIFLNKRLTECDIIVSAIPYRDGLTIIDRIILECCLETYLLQKFIAVQSDSELTAHIDEMIKTCYEKLNFGIELSADAEFSSTSYIQPIHSEIELSADPVKLFAETYEQVTSDIELAVDPFKPTLKKYLGGGSSTIEQDVELRKIIKRCMERFENGLSIGAIVEGTIEHNFEHAVSAIDVNADLKDLLYRVYRTGESMMEIAAVVKSIQLHRILGDAEVGFTIGSDVVNGDVTQKFLSVDSNLQMLVSVTSLIIQFMEPEEITSTLYAEAGAILRRFRKVVEVDPFDINDIDSMTLDWLDYVVLEE